MENAVDIGILNSDSCNSIKDEAQPQDPRPESEGEDAEHQEAHQTGTYEGSNGLV